MNGVVSPMRIVISFLLIYTSLFYSATCMMNRYWFYAYNYSLLMPTFSGRYSSENIIHNFERNPPSTFRTLPVTQLPASDAKYTAAPPTSEALPTRLINKAFFMMSSLTVLP